MSRKTDTYNDEEYNVGVYCLDLDAHVPFVDPADYGIKDLEAVRPSDYFVTSGDAVVKATHLSKDMWILAGEVRRRYGASKQKKHKDFESKIWAAAGKARSLINTLKAVRGEAIFLETEWKDHKLLCIPKNPRKKDLPE